MCEALHVGNSLSKEGFNVIKSVMDIHLVNLEGEYQVALSELCSQFHQTIIGPDIDVQLVNRATSKGRKKSRGCWTFLKFDCQSFQISTCSQVSLSKSCLFLLKGRRESKRLKVVSRLTVCKCIQQTCGRSRAHTAFQALDVLVGVQEVHETIHHDSRIFKSKNWMIEDKVYG